MDIDKSKLKSDIEDFKRRMRLKWHFRDNSHDSNSIDNANRNNDNYENSPSFYIKSGWNPPRAGPILESNLSLLEKEAMSISPQGRNFSNLSFGERQALYDLKSDKSIVIKQAGKGSAVEKLTDS